MQILNDFSTSVKKALEEIDPNYMDYHGLVICGTHTPPDHAEIEQMLDMIMVCRETNTPFLGICFGHQLAAIEYARNVLGITNASSEEFGQGIYTPIVIKRKELKVGLHDGETYWNNYEVYLPEWEKPSNFFTTQAHPEYQSIKDNPHPLLVKFIELCKKTK